MSRNLELARARARARMQMRGETLPEERLDSVRVLRTNPRNLEILNPMNAVQISLNLRALMSPQYDAKKILDRLERSGYQVFLPGHDDAEYRRAVRESKRQRATAIKPDSSTFWRRPAPEIR